MESVRFKFLYNFVGVQGRNANCRLHHESSLMQTSLQYNIYIGRVLWRIFAWFFESTRFAAIRQFIKTLVRSPHEGAREAAYIAHATPIHGILLGPSDTEPYFVLKTMKQYSKSMLQPQYEDAIGFSRYVPSSNLSRNRIDRTKQAKLLLMRISVLILKEQMTAGRIILAIMLMPYSVPVPFETLSLFQFAAPSPVVWNSQARGRFHVERNIYNDEIVSNPYRLLTISISLSTSWTFQWLSMAPFLFWWPPMCVVFWHNSSDTFMDVITDASTRKVTSH